VLVINLVFLIFKQVTVRTRDGYVAAPEDKAFYASRTTEYASTTRTAEVNKKYETATEENKRTTIEGGVNPDYQRAFNAHRNATESFVMWILASSAYLFAYQFAISHGKSDNADHGVALFSIFAGLRWFHSIVFLAGLQPWRTIFFGLALLDTIVVACLAMWLVYNWG
jgi:hypothetical protein